MSPLLHRILAVALMLGALILASLGVVRPVWQSFERLGAEAKLLAEQIDRFEAGLSNRETPNRIRIAERTLLEPADPVLAGARLQETLRGAVEAAGGELRSVTPGRAEAISSTLETVPVSAQLTITTPGLQSLLHALESARPYVVVDRLQVRRPPGGQVDSPPRLTVSLRLLGLIPAEES